MGRYDTEKQGLSWKLMIGIAVVVIAVIVGLLWIEGWDEPEQTVSEIQLPQIEEAETNDATVVEDELQVLGVQTDTMAPDETAELSKTSEPEHEPSTEVLPPLENSDNFFKREILGLVPDFSDYLQHTGLIEKYLQIVNDFSQAQRLYKHMRFLRPSQPFVAEQVGTKLYLSAAGYHRYDNLAQSFAAIDNDAAIALYQKLRPLLQQAYDEFGYPEEYRLEDIFQKAGAEMIAAPVIDERIELIRPGVLYKFADKKLESLSPVQKQMLRMGPKNTRLIQQKLRELLQRMVSLQEE